MSERVTPPLGTMTDRVQLKRRVMTGEDEGGHAVAYVPIASVWARVRGISGRAASAADGRSVTVSHAVVLRFRNDISPGDRIAYRGGSLDIISATDLDGRRSYLNCLCSEVVVTG